MTDKKEKFYITTPIYYANDQPHLGHAYTTIAADSLVRYHKYFKKQKSFLLTGVDEHGVKIEKAARRKNKSPQYLCDEISDVFEKTWKGLNISYGNFVRTTNPGHIKAVQKALQVLYDRGFIYKGVYKGLYCSGCEQYKKESDLIGGKCPDHDIEPELMEEESYVFKLSEFEDQLRKKIKSDEFEIKPKERKNEVLAFLEQGLQDISISRKKVKWGIPLPFDKDFTTYVWIDALLNYLTGIGWEGDPKSLPDDFWPVDLQLMSKDILRVHATIWPALLLALGISLPKKLFIHGYFTINGRKMSKSLGNVIWPKEMVEKFGVDATRYLLLSSTPFGRDGDISWDKLTEKYNADLANGVGNTVNRVLVMIDKYFDGMIPSQEDNSNSSNEKLRNYFWKECYDPWLVNIEKLRFDQCLRCTVNIFKKIDEDIEEFKPWQQAKEGKINQAEAQSKFYTWLESIRLSSWLTLPFMPEIAESILNQLGLDFEEEKNKDLRDLRKSAFSSNNGGLRSGTRTRNGQILFLKEH